MQSIIPKFFELITFITEYKIDILGVTETSLTGCIRSDSLKINGFTLLRKDIHGDKSGGGVLLYINKNMKL